MRRKLENMDSTDVSASIPWDTFYGVMQEAGKRFVPVCTIDDRWEELVFNALSYLQPVQRPKDGSDVTGFGSFDNSTCKRVLDLLEPGDLRLGLIVIKRVAVVKLGVNSGSGNGGSCFGIEVWTDTAKLTNMVIARFGDGWDLVRKSEVFIKYETEVSSRVSGGEWGVIDFGKLFTETNEQKFSLVGVQCKKICIHPGRNSIYILEHCEGDLCWSRSESEGRKERAECHLHRGDGLGNKRKWGYWEERCTWRRVVDQGQSLGDTAGGCVVAAVALWAIYIL